VELENILDDHVPVLHSTKLIYKTMDQYTVFHLHPFTFCESKFSEHEAMDKFGPLVIQPMPVLI